MQITQRECKHAVALRQPRNKPTIAIFAGLIASAAIGVSSAAVQEKAQKKVQEKPQSKPSVQSRFADVNGTRIHYLVAGKGEPVILLHGYAQNSHMWRPLIAELAKTHTVIAPDLRGFGQSAKPPQGYDKKTMAQDIHALAASLGYKRVRHRRPRHRPDGGLRLCRAVSGRGRSHRADGCVPAGRRRLDQCLAAARPLAFPLLRRDAAQAGRPAASASTSSISGTTSPPTARNRCRSATGSFYAKAYAQPGAMRAGFEVFRAFEQDAKDFAGFAKTKLTMPMLVLTGEKASGEFLIQQGRLVANNVEGVVIKGSGHWLIDEAPDQVMPKLVAFLTR